MPIHLLDHTSFKFPSPSKAHSSGILAVGGDLHPERILLAYRKGIFPWFSADEPPIWWCPNPRWVLLPHQLKISKSMKQVFRKQNFEISVNQNFLGVIRNCQQIQRPSQDGTWITEEIVQSYYQLFQQGYAHSVEVWENQTLVGGLYGVLLGRCFFGESMFSKVPNASKTGFICLAKNLELLGFDVIDCQVHSAHLESLGAVAMPRNFFLTIVRQSAKKATPFNLKAVFDTHLLTMIK